MSKSFTRVRYACYSTNISMSIVGNLPPLLFLTFRQMYGISFSLLGLLVLINFCTQLLVDLLFSFYSYKINIRAAVRLTPVFTVIGLLLYAAAPLIFPNSVYAGLVLGTVIFSAGSGLAEVLISPVIAAIPAENPEHEMSKLHSIYAWGVVGVVPLSTLFILAFGGEYWQILTLIMAVVPVVGTVLFLGAELPELKTPERASGVVKHMKNPAVWLCVFAIFLGGASECTMAQWASGYIEGALGIDKVWGDLFGVAMFGVMLGLGRTLYSKIGRNIERVLLLGAVGAFLCYLVSALTNIGIIGLIACAITGLCTSMLWPGSLIVASDRVPDGGVFIFAMMAAGGDLGASVAPQLVGVITDAVAASGEGMRLAAELGMSPEQLGMKTGMLVGAMFPLVAILVFLYILRSKKKRATEPLTKEQKNI